MHQEDGVSTHRGATTDLLARAIARHVHSPGDYETALPALSFHRRDAPTEPMPCIYPLSLALTTQGGTRGNPTAVYTPRFVRWNLTIDF
jgi:hypothetical protein